MRGRVTIGQLAAAADVPTTTVRYYERRGLLGPAARTGSGNYRSYGDAEIKRLQFIRAAQATGLTLEDVATLLALRDGATQPCQEVQSLVEERLDDVAERVRDLRRVERVLRASLEMCRQFERTGHCEMIDTLGRRSPQQKSPRRRFKER